MAKTKPKEVKREMIRTGIRITYEDGSTEIMFDTRGKIEQVLCADGRIHAVYFPRYPHSRRCADCHYFDAYGPDPDGNPKQPFGWCLWLNPRKSHKIPQKVWEGENECPHFRLLIPTKEFFDQQKGTEGDFCKNWNQKR